MEQLLTELGVQRVTVRVDVPDAVFPVRYEALAPGAGSLRDDSTDLTKQPVPRVLAEQRRPGRAGGLGGGVPGRCGVPRDARALRRHARADRHRVLSRRRARRAALDPRPARAAALREAERGLCRAAAAAIAGELDDTP